MTVTQVELGPAPLDLVDVYAGEPNPLQFHLHVGPVDTDLTGFTGQAQVRRTAASVDVAATGIVTFTDPTNGIFVLTWDGDELRTLLFECDRPRWQGVWDLEISNGGVPDTLFAGKFITRLDVTR